MVYSVLLAPLPFLLLGSVSAGLLGAGTGAGSCAAFPFRSDDIDHVGGCPRWAECCTEFGYCHGRDSWEAGYFRDCNGESNGTPLPGSVIKLEAAEAAKGPTKVTPEMLGISSEIWISQINKAVAILSSTSSSSTSSTSSSSSSVSSSATSSVSSQNQLDVQQQNAFVGSQTGSQSGQFSTSDLVSQIILALRPQISQAVQVAVQGSTTSSAVSGNSFSSQSQQSQLDESFGQNFNSVSLNDQISFNPTSTLTSANIAGTGIGQSAQFQQNVQQSSQSEALSGQSFNSVSVNDQVAFNPTSTFPTATGANSFNAESAQFQQNVEQSSQFQESSGLSFNSISVNDQILLNPASTFTATTTGTNGLNAQFQQNAGQSFNSVSGTSQSSSLETSQLVALILEQLRPQIALAVSNAV